MAEKADLPSDNISLPPMYAHSETFTESSPPAYRKPGMAAVRIARIVCVTLLAMTFIVGFFVVSHKWIQTRECNCDKHDSLSSLQQAALLQMAPDLQILDSNNVEDATKEKKVDEENKEMNINLVTEEAVKRQEEKEDEKRINAIEEAMKERVEELSKNIKLPVDLLLGNPALAGRNVQCKVQKKQQNIADGIISQAIIVTCDDDENSTEDDSERTPISILPPGMRRLNPPMSLLGHIMKILASRPRSEGMRPEISRIERPLPSFPLKPMESQVPIQRHMITPISGSFQAPIMIPNNGGFPGPFSQGAIHIIPIRKLEIARPEPEAEEDENNNEPLMFSSQSPTQLRQMPMIREITGLPLRRPVESSFQPQLPFRNPNEEEEQQRHPMESPFRPPFMFTNQNEEQQRRPMESSFQPQIIFRNLNEEEQQRNPMESSFQPRIIFRNLNDEQQQRNPMKSPFQPQIIFRNLNEEQQQRNPMESSFQPQIIFRNLNEEQQQRNPMESPFQPQITLRNHIEEEQHRNELPIPFPFTNGQMPIRVVRLPSGSNLFREEEDNEQREETNPEEEQQEGPLPFSPIQQLMNLFPARRTRIIRLRPKQNEESTNSEMLPFPISRDDLPLQNTPRELPPIHLPPQMPPMEASGRALPAPVALPEVRVVRFPFIPQPQPISEATVETHMEVQQPQEDEQEEENQQPQIDNSFFREEPQVPRFFQNQPENNSFRKINGEFGPPKTHTVIEASPEPIPLDADFIPFPPQIFRHLGFNRQIPSEFKPQSREKSDRQILDGNDSQPPKIFTSQLPLEFNPMSQHGLIDRPQQGSDSLVEPINFPPEQDDNSQANKELESEQLLQEPITQPQFQPRFIAPPPQRFVQEREITFPVELNSDAEAIDNNNDDGNAQQEDSNLHRIVLN